MVDFDVVDVLDVVGLVVVDDVVDFDVVDVLDVVGLVVVDDVVVFLDVVAVGRLVELSVTVVIVDVVVNIRKHH